MMLIRRGFEFPQVAEKLSTKGFSLLWVAVKYFCCDELRRDREARRAFGGKGLRGF
jgi:hypothetical protein